MTLRVALATGRTAGGMILIGGEVQQTGPTADHTLGTAEGLGLFDILHHEKMSV